MATRAKKSSKRKPAAKARRRKRAETPGTTPAAGTAGWIDLTVSNADEVRDFYADVLGWQVAPVDMGGYSDYSMIAPATGQAVAGVCHARGVNEGLPPCWLVYFMVENLSASVAHVERRGGRVIRPAGPMGPMGRFAVVTDPAGAACVLFEAAGPASKS